MFDRVAAAVLALPPALRLAAMLHGALQVEDVRQLKFRIVVPISTSAS
jgi:hypothetical protein